MILKQKNIQDILYQELAEERVSLIDEEDLQVLEWKERHNLS